MVYNLTATTMNIALISYWTCPLERVGVLAAGGMNIYILHLANALSKLGHKVDIYTRAHNDREEVILKYHENVRIIHLNIKSENPISEFSNKITGFIKRNKFNYDLIHTHYYLSGLSGMLLKKKLSIPHFSTFHSLGRTKEIYFGIKDEYRIKTEKEVAENVDAIIASTELEKKDLIENYDADRKKIFVVAPGVNHLIFKPKNRILSRLRLQLPLNKQTILFVGRIDPIKGINFLIEAIANLSGIHQSFENKFRMLIIGGDVASRGFWQNSEVIKIKQLIAAKNLECCIKFIGSKSHSQLPYYYSASDVVVMPSLYESFGLVVLEAMACGSCVVASRVGGLKYLIEENINGRFFEMGDIKSLSGVLWDLLNDKNQRELLGKHAYISSQDYCWDIQATKISGIYKNFI